MHDAENVLARLREQLEQCNQALHRLNQLASTLHGTGTAMPAHETVAGRAQTEITCQWKMALRITATPQPPAEEQPQPAKPGPQLSPDQPALIEMTLPDFREGYQRGVAGYFNGEGTLNDVDLVEVLCTLAAEGLFSREDEALLHWHIGRLLGQLCGKLHGRPKVGAA